MGAVQAIQVQVLFVVLKCLLTHCRCVLRFRKRKELRKKKLYSGLNEAQLHFGASKSTFPFFLVFDYFCASNYQKRRKIIIFFTSYIYFIYNGKNGKCLIIKIGSKILVK